MCAPENNDFRAGFSLFPTFFDVDSHASEKFSMKSMTYKKNTTFVYFPWFLFHFLH